MRVPDGFDGDKNSFVVRLERELVALGLHLPL